MDAGIAQEMMRRRVGMAPPSRAGLGPPSNIGNPGFGGMMGGGQRPAPAPAMSPPSPMGQPGIQQLQKSQPDEATMIVRALIQRLRDLTPKTQ